MHRLLDTTLRSIQQDLDLHLDATFIHQVAHDIGFSWRRRILTPCTIVHWLIHQVLVGHTALRHLAQRSGHAFTASALCQARKRLPLLLLQTLLKAQTQSLATHVDQHPEGRWKGHRLLLTDGSSFTMPDTPALQKQFGQHKSQQPGCGFPTAKFLALFHAQTGLLIQVEAAHLHTHEMSQIGRLHPLLQPNDVLVGDRGFCSYAHLALLVVRGVHGVFRVHQKQIVDFTPQRPHAQGTRTAGLPRSRWVATLGPHDQTVEYFRPAKAPSWMSAEEFAALPASIVVREVRYRVGSNGFRTQWVTLVTTLVTLEEATSAELSEVYAMRWRVEQNLRDLKQTLKMDVMKSQTVDGVRKELTTFAMVYNLVRLVMGVASRRQGVSWDRISFVSALRWLSDASPGDPLMDLVVNPRRPNRFEPRVCKRRPKTFSLMTKPRQQLRESLAMKQVTP